MSMDQQSALEALVAGNERFQQDQLEHPRRDGARRRELASGQQPFAIALTCADSRVAPEIAFDAGLGELFVVRVAGNVANISSIASIEYAVAHLGSKLIVVLGHESCGAVAAALEGGDPGENLSHLLGHIAPAIDAAGEKTVESVVRSNAKVTAARLSSESRIIGDAVASGDVRIVPAYYQLASGAVELDLAWVHRVGLGDDLHGLPKQSDDFARRRSALGP